MSGCTQSSFRLGHPWDKRLSGKISTVLVYGIGNCGSYRGRGSYLSKWKVGGKHFIQPSMISITSYRSNSSYTKIWSCQRHSSTRWLSTQEQRENIEDGKRAFQKKAILWSTIVDLYSVNDFPETTQRLPVVAPRLVSKCFCRAETQSCH